MEQDIELNNQGSNDDAGLDNAAQGSSDDEGKQAGKAEEKENPDTGLGKPEQKEIKKDEGADDKGVYGAPETYDYKDIKIPDGYEYDKDMLKEFDALNKECNLSQQSANKYMEFGLRLAQKYNADLPKVLQQVHQAKVAQFQQAINTDAEIGGGDKAKIEAYLDVADKGYTAFANDKVKNALAEAGLNYHPEIIKMFHKIGKLVGDDKIYATKAPVSATDTASILYGSN